MKVEMSKDPMTIIRELKQIFPGLKALVMSKKDISKLESSSIWQEAYQYVDNDSQKFRELRNVSRIEIREE